MQQQRNEFTNQEFTRRSINVDDGSVSTDDRELLCRGQLSGLPCGYLGKKVFNNCREGFPNNSKQRTGFGQVTQNVIHNISHT